MPRLFTAIEIPEGVATALSLLKGGLPGARWIDRENYHVTLRFIGDIDLRTANEIADELGRIRREAFAVRIEGLGAFGSRKPHSIHASLAPSRALKELAAEQERIIQRIGLPAETRKFTPHVTLARLRGASQRDVADYLALRGGFSAGPIPVRRFVLLSSRDGTGGGPYVLEEAYDLDEPREAAPMAMNG